MNLSGYSTMTQKGQVVIPEPIRRHFNLRQSSRLYFEIRKNEIVAKPAMTVDEAFGFIKTKKRATQKEMDEAIAQGYVQRYLRSLK